MFVFVGSSDIEDEGDLDVALEHQTSLSDKDFSIDGDNNTDIDSKENILTSVPNNNNINNNNNNNLNKSSSLNSLPPSPDRSSRVELSSPLDSSGQLSAML